MPEIAPADLKKSRHIRASHLWYSPYSYSPVTVHMTVRSRPAFTSSSRRTICCHVPQQSAPPAIGTVREGPTSAALTCERPLPSPHFALGVVFIIGCKNGQRPGEICQHTGLVLDRGQRRCRVLHEQVDQPFLNPALA